MQIKLAGPPECLWRYAADGDRWEISPPTFEVAGQTVTAAVTSWQEVGPPRTLPHG